jgi:Flp pilus assembly protein TadD
VAARIALALTALLLAAGLAVELYANRLLASAQGAALTQRPSPAARDAALRDLSRVADLRPGTQALLLAAGLEQRAGRYDQAFRLAARATRREPGNFSSWLTMGLAQRAAGDEAGARSSFARASRLNPRYPTPR